ncbi:MAG TPA: PepSY-associated TM helix domain-containing protein [Verrucomicrobiae bacterium]|nr:PepSY-associated TM helix domain-containing protein [Verrucomicrobiae bacterium]
MKLRSLIFWIHLASGVTAGAIILVMSLTGAAIAFEKELLAWAERDNRFVTPPTGEAPRLSMESLVARVRQERPAAKPSGITVFADPRSAVQMSLGRTNSLYVNPYTGEIREQGTGGLRAFLRTMTDWHRWLGQNGGGRAVGKAITGACNVAFLFLALSGLYLWWPRKWSWPALKTVAVFNMRLRGKARDWNWHNVIGVWTAPVLIVLTASGTIISYRWASDLVYRLAGEPPPVAGPAGSPAVPLSTPEPGAKPLGPDALLSQAKGAAPRWEQMTIRFEGNSPRNGSPTSPQNSGEPGPRGSRRGNDGDKPQAFTVSVREHGMWPLFGANQYSLDPFTGSVLRKETFADYTPGRKFRSWLRFLHTGEALGLPGKTIAAIASLGGAALVFTGLSLAIRRFLAWRQKADSAGVPLQPAPELK